MTDVRAELKKLIFEVMNVDIDKIDNDKSLSTVDEWDSFNNLMLISRVEDRFSLKFSVKDIEDVDTITKIVELVKNKLEK
jgi:acyl carrier protein